MGLRLGHFGTTDCGASSPLEISAGRNDNVTNRYPILPGISISVAIGASTSPQLYPTFLASYQRIYVIHNHLYLTAGIENGCNSGRLFSEAQISLPLRLGVNSESKICGLGLHSNLSHSFGRQIRSIGFRRGWRQYV